MTILLELINAIQQSPLTVMVVAGILGLCVGSFLNVVIYRTPAIMKKEWRLETAHFWQEQPDLADNHKQALLDTIKNDTPLTLSFPPSRCPKCAYQIRWYENIPVLSWLALRGKCSGCQNPISMRYPLVELMTALSSVVVVYTLGANIQGMLGVLFTWILVALTGIDFDEQLLPDRLVYPLGMIGLLANAFGIFTSPVSAIFGAVFGFFVLWSVATAFMFLMKKQGMGHGDFKLLAALGAWLGVGMLPLIIMLSCLIGSIVGGALMIKNKGSQQFAFGPYIAIAGFVALLWGTKINHWYLSSFM